MHRIRIAVFSLIIVIASIGYAQPVKFQTYVTAGQVSSLFGDAQKSQTTIDALKRLHIQHVYLETIRGVERAPFELLTAARDALQANEISVSAGVATIFGKGFGVDSDKPGIWMNYQAEKTQRDLADHISKIAPLFDELIIDDFLATDDESADSQQARGERSWSEYRLELMTQISEEFITAPARKANPEIRVILKYPQWYDRFHRFGYNVETGHTLYDRIWVGTETRNPDTVRFGFVQPTQGFINYTYIKSFAGDKMGGAWFDFGDCTPGAYLMQAYQSVLAGARELTLFETGSIVANNECLSPFRERQTAVSKLGEIVGDAQLIGIPSYKPAHSEASDGQGGANLFIYDYLACMGLTPVMFSDLAFGYSPGAYTFLPRQAADDPIIIERIRRGGHWLTTPDFIQALDKPEMAEFAGYSEPLDLNQPLVEVDAFWVKDKTIDVEKGKYKVRALPWPEEARVHVAAIVDGATVPILFTNIYGARGERVGLIRTINFPTFRHEEFGPDREQFLPPRPLAVTDWPDEVVQEIQKSFLPIRGIHAQAPNGVSIYQYHDKDELVVFANFNDEAVECSIKYYDKFSKGEMKANNHFVLHPAFPHQTGTTIQDETTNGEMTFRVKVMPWEVAVVKQDLNL
ncbi:MAG: hypothetical protein P9L94_14000 [Candidatus Hinthialibacter antarcticus]|nr:hypothetical protein [Candidatus Hinthialibacter antarcticus]